MIEKPEIKEEKIIDVLKENYSIQARQLEFLPIGNDASSFAYRVEDEYGDSYFLKLKTKLPNPAGLFVPRFLKDNGFQQVVAPLSAKTQNLFGGVDEFFIILYPFIRGNEAMQVGMTDAQWTEFGSTLKRIHETGLPLDISQHVKLETFVPQWSRYTQELNDQIKKRNYDDPCQKDLAAFWKENNKTIQTLVDRTEMIGQRLQETDLKFVLCHADIHTANIIITREQEMFIVDWDDTLLAPKERDLMFVLGAGTRPEQSFFNAYGNVKINQLALAYYRYEWCVQEIGDFGKRVFCAKDIAEDTKQNALEGFIKLFSHGDVIERALDTPFEAGIRNHL